MASSPTLPQHPSPERGQAGWLSLLVGLAGAPAAWVALITLGNILASAACFPHRMPLPQPVWHHLKLWLGGISALSIAVGIGAGITAYLVWQRTKHEIPDALHPADTGTGRTRFLALLGLMSSSLFTIAMIFIACALLIAPLCHAWF